MSDPNAVLEAIEGAQHAFGFVGTGSPDFQEGVSRESEWKTQLTKGCRYLESARTLRARDGFNGAVIELCFGAIERSLEAYTLLNSADDLSDYRDHEAVYDRAVELGLFENDTSNDLKHLYGGNRTEHYYGSRTPTQAREDAMSSLAEAIHEYVTDQIQVGGVCICD